MKNLFVVVGGLGKNIIWTSLIEQLNVKCGENISVMTPWPFVFYNNKNKKNDITNAGYFESYIAKTDIVNKQAIKFQLSPNSFILEFLTM